MSFGIGVHMDTWVHLDILIQGNLLIIIIFAVSSFP